MKSRKNPGARDDVPNGLDPVEVSRDLAESDRHGAREAANGDDIGYSTYRHLPHHRKDQTAEWYEVKWATGSDYSGGAVTKANYNELSRMLDEDFPEGTKPPVWFRASGGHGTYSLLVKWPALSDEIVEVLNGLEEYPAIDDQAVSEEENERENEAWESWAKDDFQKAFLKAWNENWSDEPELEDWPDAVTDGMTYSMFHVGMELANENWVHEEGSSVFIKMDRIADKLVDLLAGGTVPNWLSPDQFSEMLEASEAFGMQVVKSELVGRRSQPATSRELEARGQQRLPHVKNHRTLESFAGDVAKAETDADREMLRLLARTAPPSGLPVTDRKYWILLQLLAKEKLQAIGLRLTGQIARATHFERQAELIYKQLPANLKW